MTAPLVNAHTHLEGSWLAGVRPDAPQPFPVWLQRHIRRSRLLKQLDDAEARQLAAIEAGIEALLAAGTTHIGDISQTGLSIEPLLDSGLAGVVYIELLGLEAEAGTFMFERALQLLDRYRPQERHGLRIGLTAHAPYSVRPEIFSRVAAFCAREAVPLCIHAAETPAENELLLHGRGALYDLPIRLGGQTRPHVPGQTAVRYLADLGVLEAQPLLVHMVHVSDEELDLVAQSGSKVAHCPRSNRLLQAGGRMPLEKMLARGIPVALGTDSLASSPSLDVREEAASARRLHGAAVAPAVIDTLLGNAAVF